MALNGCPRPPSPPESSLPPPAPRDAMDLYVVYTCINISLSLSIYIYIYIHMMYIYIYIYIYTRIHMYVPHGHPHGTASTPPSCYTKSDQVNTSLRVPSPV